MHDLSTDSRARWGIAWRRVRSAATDGTIADIRKLDTWRQVDPWSVFEAERLLGARDGRCRFSLYL